MNIPVYLSEQHNISEADAKVIWEKVKKQVDKFAMNKGYVVGGPEYYALSKWYSKSLLGEVQVIQSTTIKTFKQFLSDRGEYL